jgi:Ca-activated chloride channel family protein
VATIVAVLAVSCGDGSRGGSGPDSERRDPLVDALAPASPLSLKSGLAAAILIDTSGSMAEAPRGSNETKIVSARRAALDLVAQFAQYADAHPAEPVMLGIYEFSTRSGQPDAREVIPMGPPQRERAATAVAGMRPDGDTPIGGAMIIGKRALDATDLARRHLLVITDGENTDGYTPEEVAAAIGRRPDLERPSLYFVAFNIGARRFDDVKKEGVQVLEAADSRALNQTLDELLRGEILLER